MIDSGIVMTSDVELHSMTKIMLGVVAFVAAVVVVVVVIDDVFDENAFVVVLTVDTLVEVDDVNVVTDSLQ